MRQLWISSLAVVVGLAVFAAPCDAVEPPKNVTKVLDWLAKRTKTKVVTCPEAQADEDAGMLRVCGITEMSPKKFHAKVLNVFDLLGPHVRTAWNQGTRVIGGGFIFVDSGSWMILVALSTTGSMHADDPEYYNVSFTLFGGRHDAARGKLPDG